MSLRSSRFTFQSIVRPVLCDRRRWGHRVFYTRFLLVHTGHNSRGDVVMPRTWPWEPTNCINGNRTNPLRTTGSMLGLDSKYQHMPRGTNIFTDLTARRGSHEVERGGLVSSDCHIIRTIVHPRQVRKA